MQNLWNEVRDALRAWADGEVPSSTVTGICYNLKQLVDELDGGIPPYDLSAVLSEAWAEWDLYSGDPDYPVPGVGGTSAEVMYDRVESMWDGEYGAMRRDLCRHTADWLEANGYAK